RFTGAGRSQQVRLGSRPVRPGSFVPQVVALEDRTLMTVTAVVGPNVNVGHESLNQAETVLAVNPTNPQNLFAISNNNFEDVPKANMCDMNPPPIAFFGNAYAAYSSDGGTTWTRSAVGFDGFLPDFTVDPQAVFDPLGRLFVSYES